MAKKKVAYVGFGRRLVAVLIDSILLSIVSAMMTDDKALYFLLSTGYFVWMNGMYGATVGKMIMRMRIAKENGDKLSYADALLREVASYLSLAVFCLGYLAIIGDPKKQGWHDKIAKTVVVET